MEKVKEKTIAICDNDISYALAFGGALDKALYGRFNISTFNSSSTLRDYMAGHDVETAIISESSYDSDLMQTTPGTLILLRETPDFVEEGAIIINRYQSRDALMESVLKVLPAHAATSDGSGIRAAAWKIIGVYSPIRRSLQTSFCLSMGQMLGRDHRVLYMNFENYSGFSGWFNTEFKNDILDLLYYFDCEKDRLAMRLPLLVHRIGDLDILPPAGSYHDTYDRSGDMWNRLIDAIGNSTDYDYLILDLTDAMQGLLEVMAHCDRIYTLVKGDELSRAKLSQYERWMVEHAQADIMSKTLKFELPQFKDLPISPDMLTHCELADYVRAVIRDDE